MRLNLQNRSVRMIAYLTLAITLFFGLKPFNFISKNDVYYDQTNHGLRFNASGSVGDSDLRSIAYTDDVLALPPQSSLSLYMEIVPDRKPSGLGTIAQISDGGVQPPLIIAQWQNNLAIRSRRLTGSSEQPYQEYGIGDCFADSKTSKILLAYQPGETRVYLNRQLVSRRRGFDLVERNHSTTGQLILGSNGVGGSLWLGLFKRFALYDKFVTPEEFENREVSPLIEYDFRNLTARKAPNLSAEGFALQLPLRYASPFSKPFTRMEEWDPRRTGALRDLILNIIGFFPSGFAIYLLLSQRKRSRLFLFLATTCAAFAISLFIESSQVLLPSRDPSQIDLLCNTIGGIIAAIAAHLFMPMRENGLKFDF